MDFCMAVPIRVIIGTSDDSFLNYIDYHDRKGTDW